MAQDSDGAVCTACTCRMLLAKPVGLRRLQAGQHWSKGFTAKLTQEVKLVGCTISCEPTQHGSGPHVQSYVVVTDAVRASPPPPPPPPNCRPPRHTDHSPGSKASERSCIRFWYSKYLPLLLNLPLPLFVNIILSACTGSVQASQRCCQHEISSCSGSVC